MNQTKNQLLAKMQGIFNTPEMRNVLSSQILIRINNSDLSQQQYEENINYFGFVESGDKKYIGNECFVARLKHISGDGSPAEAWEADFEAHLDGENIKGRIRAQFVRNNGFVVTVEVLLP